jgi:hypothetical protein
MNAQCATVVCFLSLALALSLMGPTDGQMALYAVGGAECNHSSSSLITYDCEEINGRTDSCGNTQIVTDPVPTCKDIFVEPTTVCTENNCQQVTKNAQRNSSCTKVGCGS